MENPMSDAKNIAQDKLVELKKTFKLGRYKHYKGKYYTVFALTIHENTCEILVHYYSHENKTRWTRTIEDFTDHVENSTYEFKGRRFIYHSSSHPSLMLEAVGYDDMVEGFKHIERTLEFFKQIQGGN
jgi:hypothetical protein